MQAENFTDGCIGFAQLGIASPNDPLAYVGLAFNFSRFSEHAETSARKNGIDPDRFGFSYIRGKEQPFLLAALALMHRPQK